MKIIWKIKKRAIAEWPTIELGCDGGIYRAAAQLHGPVTFATWAREDGVVEERADHCVGGEANAWCALVIKTASRAGGRVGAKPSGAASRDGGRFYRCGRRTRAGVYTTVWKLIRRWK